LASVSEEAVVVLSTLVRRLVAGGKARGKEEGGIISWGTGLLLRAVAATSVAEAAALDCCCCRVLEATWVDTRESISSGFIEAAAAAVVAA
jgi:hypothetical protein